MSQHYNDQHKYDDMIHLPYQKSTRHTPMSLQDRAAQFAPFMALTGYDDAIEETARLTESKIELDESVIAKINEKLFELSEHLSEKRNVSITYFQPDELKLGGAYITEVGTIKRIDANEEIIVMDDHRRIPMKEIVNVSIF